MLIEAESYLLQLVRYIHRNPLKAGLTETPEDYPWTSHEGCLSKDRKSKVLQLYKIPTAAPWTRTAKAIG